MARLDYNGIKYQKTPGFFNWLGGSRYYGWLTYNGTMVGIDKMCASTKWGLKRKLSHALRNHQFPWKTESW